MSGKWGIKHTGAELDAMAEVAKSAKNRYVYILLCTTIKLYNSCCFFCYFFNRP